MNTKSVRDTLAAFERRLLGDRVCSRVVGDLRTPRTLLLFRRRSQETNSGPFFETGLIYTKTTRLLPVPKPNEACDSRGGDAARVYGDVDRLGERAAVDGEDGAGGPRARGRREEQRRAGHVGRAP